MIDAFHHTSTLLRHIEPDHSDQPIRAKPFRIANAVEKLKDWPPAVCIGIITTSSGNADRYTAFSNHISYSIAHKPHKQSILEGQALPDDKGDLTSNDIC